MAILFKFPRDRGSYCFFQKILARRMLKDDVNSSFPVVLRRVLNYALGYCVVDVFYSGPRGEVEIHYHFQRFRLLKDSDQCPGSAILRISSLYSGQIALVASLDFPQLLGDPSILRFARFLLSFSFLLPICDPGDF